MIGDVRWIFTSSVKMTVYDYERFHVYDHGLIFERFRPRFSLNTSVPLLYGLDISNVQLNDVGNYTCIGGQRDIHIHNLIVQGKWRP